MIISKKALLIYLAGAFIQTSALASPVECNLTAVENPMEEFTMDENLSIEAKGNGIYDVDMNGYTMECLTTNTSESTATITCMLPVEDEFAIYLELNQETGVINITEGQTIVADYACPTTGDQPTALFAPNKFFYVLAANTVN